MLARPSLMPPAAGSVRKYEDEVRELRDDLMMLGEDLDKDRVVQGELSERIDFLERTVVRLRDEFRHLKLVSGWSLVRVRWRCGMSRTGNIAGENEIGSYPMMGR